MNFAYYTALNGTIIWRLTSNKIHEQAHYERHSRNHKQVNSIMVPRRVPRQQLGLWADWRSEFRRQKVKVFRIDRQGENLVWKQRWEQHQRWHSSETMLCSAGEKSEFYSTFKEYIFNYFSILVEKVLSLEECFNFKKPFRKEIQNLKFKLFLYARLIDDMLNMNLYESKRSIFYFPIAVKLTKIIAVHDLENGTGLYSRKSWNIKDSYFSWRDTVI